MKLLDFLGILQVLKGHIALGNAVFPNGTCGITRCFLICFPFVNKLFQLELMSIISTTLKLPENVESGLKVE